LRSVDSVVRKWALSDHGGCDGKDDLAELLEGLKLSAIPLAPAQKVVLAEAGQGCARGAQGANGNMWVIRLDGATPVLLAGPDEQFGGWLYSIQSSNSNGYRDIVLGWHMSSFDTELSYFRFDGKRYRRISGASRLDQNEERKPTIYPRKQ
jgi:hypothetical protein